ncbi:hypothetical protein [Rhodococcus jostii]|uniref:hypothetical protein n=1 Tax=Rhodococcus jostii TaxID=132919 RepID=UPI00364E8965
MLIGSVDANPTLYDRDAFRALLDTHPDLRALWRSEMVDLFAVWREITATDVTA